MRFKATASIFSLYFLISVVHALICIQQDDPRNPLSRVQVNCSPSSRGLNELVNPGVLLRSALTENTSSLSFQGLISPVASILTEDAPPQPTEDVNSANMFHFDVVCPSAVSVQTCNKVNTTIYHAGQLISNVLVLTSKINVNVTLSSFCDAQQVCSGDSEIISLAAAAPARTIPLIDEDGITRLYPQAATKQFASMLNGVPQFSDYDVNLNVNSDAAFFYPDVDTHIAANQTDFLFVVLHELMHGIGFTSSYEDYFHESTASNITPNVLLTYTADRVVFQGFIESAFDKNFVFANHAVVTNLVRNINQQVTTYTQNMTFNDTESLTSFILDVPGFDATSQSLTSNFTTANTTFYAARAKNESSILLQLETAIRPYSSGSSISHFAADTYANTGDFLMRASLTKGVTLAQTIENAKLGGATGTELYGAIGPGLRSVLGSLGYRVRGGIPAKSQIMTAASVKANAQVTSGSQRAALSMSMVSISMLLWFA